MLAYLLLQDCSDMGVGGVGSRGEDSSGEGVGQGNCGDESRLGGGEGGVQGRALGLPASAAVSGRSVPATPGRKR